MSALLTDFHGPSPDLAAKVAYLRCPATHGVSSVEALETHMSWVFLAGDVALKLKKPVRFPFLDFSTLAAREHDCREEVRLNARLAPSVYLGLRRLQWDGTSLALSPDRGPAPGRTVEWLVLMRRLPSDQMLDARVSAGRVAPEDIEPVVALLGRFYRHAPKVPVNGEEYVANFHREQAANREVLLRPQFELQRSAAALNRMDRALVDHADLLRERSRSGRIVEGHGDLRPEHVCLSNVVFTCPLTARSICGTGPARGPTIRLTGLSGRRLGADSTAIEDIPSSMPPEGTRHERHPANPLHLHRLPRHQLHLRLPARRCLPHPLRLRPAVPVWPAMRLRRAVPMRRCRALRPVLTAARSRPATPPHPRVHSWKATSWPMPAASSAPC